MLAGERRVLQISSWVPEHRRGTQRALIRGRELPGEVGATDPAPLHMLCLAPGDWLLVASTSWIASFNRHVVASLPQQGLVVVDVTDALAVLTVRGRAARDVLSKGCGLDLRQEAFSAGRCARTRFAQLPLVIDCTDDAPVFDLYVARSQSRWLAEWIADAAAEFGGSAQRRSP